VGHLAGVPLQREWAAVLACGEDAVVSHRSAAAFWRLLPWDGPVEVTVAQDRRPRRRGVTVHRPASLDARDIRVRDGLRVTSPRRTILDLSPVLSLDALDRLVSEALVQRLVTARELEPVAGAKLRTVLGVARPARNAAERALLALIRRAGLPVPEVNATVGDFEVDFLWREHGVALELDGFQAHGNRRAFDRDRRKDLALRAHGLTPARIGWRQVADTPEAVVADLARLTARRAG
jgi:very-short-patch-repair endonuclease